MVAWFTLGEWLAILLAISTLAGVIFSAYFKSRHDQLGELLKIAEDEARLHRERAARLETELAEERAAFHALFHFIGES